MGKPMMLHERDDELIEQLKDLLGVSSKVEVVRMALALLVESAKREEAAGRWKQAVKLATNESRKVNADFRKHARLRKID